ncbi:tripartite tricarboxylate transporter TctB family protein [Inquilinus sp. CAU 1745]|uniref:tripartite tricarboxylate transporter TctB family protein n=1 Tax=Inquilinus sp. CAU 1745 TaxID=3140369 RepID=UPI00325C210E
MAFVPGKILFDLVLLALAALALNAALQLPAGTGMLSSGSFPSAILWLGMGLMVIVLFRDVLDVRKKVSEDKAGPKKDFRKRTAICLALMAAELVIYIVSFEAIGFLVGTIFFLIFGYLTCGILLNSRGSLGRAHTGKMIGTSVIVAVSISIVCYFLFTRLFGLALP